MPGVPPLEKAWEAVGELCRLLSPPSYHLPQVLTGSQMMSLKRSALLGESQSQLRPVSNSTVVCNGQSPCLSLERSETVKFAYVGPL